MIHRLTRHATRDILFQGVAAAEGGSNALEEMED